MYRQAEGWGEGVIKGAGEVRRCTGRRRVEKVPSTVLSLYRQAEGVGEGVVKGDGGVPAGRGVGKVSSRVLGLYRQTEGVGEAVIKGVGVAMSRMIGEHGQQEAGSLLHVIHGRPVCVREEVQAAGRRAVVAPVPPGPFRRHSRPSCRAILPSPTPATHMHPT